MLTTAFVHLTTHAAAQPAVALLAADKSVDPNATIKRVQVVLLGVLGVVLICIAIAGMASHGRKGNTSRSVDVFLATFILLPLAVIGAAGLALSVGGALFGWFLPGFGG